MKETFIKIEPFEGERVHYLRLTKSMKERLSKNQPVTVLVPPEMKIPIPGDRSTTDLQTRYATSYPVFRGDTLHAVTTTDHALFKSLPSDIFIIENVLLPMKMMDELVEGKIAFPFEIVKRHDMIV